MASRMPMIEPLRREEKILIRLATLHLSYALLLALFGLLLLCYTLTTTWSGRAGGMTPLGPLLVPELAARIAAVVGLWSYAAINFWAAKCLEDRRHCWYCLTTACLNCLFIPFGTAVGVFTLCVLPRKRYRALFRPAEASTPTNHLTDTPA